MKTTNLLVLALTLSMAQAYAQQSEEQVLNSAPINVDGYLHEERPVTDGELEEIRSELNKQKTGTQLNKTKAKDLGKLTQQTEKLLESQDEYIDQKIESTQAIKEFNNKYAENQKKLKCIMEESTSSECDPYKSQYRKNKKEEVVKEEVQEVKVAQAAPVVSTAEVITAKDLNKPFEEIAFLPYAGSTTYNGKSDTLETELSAGLRLESNVTTRFSIGVGFNYSQMKTQDFANGFNYGSGYYGANAYGNQGREIQYKSMGLDFYGKFYLTNGERFKPYIGAGFGYNRASLKYNDNNPWFDQVNSYYYGSEEYTTSFMTGSLMLGTQIMVTQTFGLNIEGAYATGLGNGLSSNANKNYSIAPDEKRLKDLGNEIINSNMLSIFAGAVIKF